MQEPKGLALDFLCTDSFMFSLIFSEIIESAEGMFFCMFGPMSNPEITYMLHCCQKEQLALAVNASV